MTGSTRPQTAERITVTLIPKAAEDLHRLQERTSFSKTDITNRAISLYEFIDSKLRDGDDIFIRNKETGEIERLVWLL